MTDERDNDNPRFNLAEFGVKVGVQIKYAEDLRARSRQKDDDYAEMMWQGYIAALNWVGTAGLAAAVDGASEGMKPLLLDSHGPGGQAGTSSRIENYLGFPNGVSGSDLARRAVTQAQRLGAEFMTHVEVLSVSVEVGYKPLTLLDDCVIVDRAVIGARGESYCEHSADRM